MNYGKKLLILGIFLAGLGAVFFLLFPGKNSFNNFRGLKEKLIAAEPAVGGGREINFIWDKTKSRLEPFAQAGASEIGAKTETKTAVADLDGDGLSEEFVLSRGFLRIGQGGKLIWQSPEEWWIDGFSLADANGDGREEINLSVWKAGDFGRFLPFWIKRNDRSVKNHFFVMSLSGGAVRPLWQSSNLEKPNCEFLFSDVDGDGRPELAAVEGEYEDGYGCRGKYLALWRWNGWGFTNDWRSPAGAFKNLRPSRDGRSFFVSVQ